MEELDLRIPKVQVKVIRELVEKGKFPNRSEAIRAAVRSLVRTAADEGILDIQAQVTKIISLESKEAEDVKISTADDFSELLHLFSSTNKMYTYIKLYQGKSVPEISEELEVTPQALYQHITEFKNHNLMESLDGSKGYELTEKGKRTSEWLLAGIPVLEDQTPSDTAISKQPESDSSMTSDETLTNQINDGYEHSWDSLD